MNWNVPIAELLAIMLGAARTGAWLMLCPPFNSRMIPGPVKAMLSVGLTLPMAPYLRTQLPSLETTDIIATAAFQMFIGAALGFVTYLFFAAIQAAGDLIDVFGGFTLAAALDPFSFNQSSVFGRFYNLLAITLMFASGAHMLVIRGFLQTFRTLPLNAGFSMGTFSELLVKGVSEMFLAALQIAGPLIAVLFLTDVAMGLLNRVAPALNAFQLGFPIKIALVLMLAGTAMAMLPGALANLMSKAVSAVVHLGGG